MRLRVDIRTNDQMVRTRFINGLISCVAIIKMTDGTLHDGVFIKNVNQYTRMVYIQSVHDYTQIEIPLSEIRDITIH